MVANVSLDALERAVYAQRFETAAGLLLQILQTMGGRAPTGFVREDSGTVVSAEEESRLYTRLGGAMLALMANPKFSLSQSGYEQLAAASAEAGAVFELSGYHSSEHIWRLLAQERPGGNPVLTEQGLRKGYALASISSTPPEVVRAIETVPRPVAVPALLSLLSTSMVLSDQANEARNIALRLGHLFDAYPASERVIGMLIKPWMLCSYAEIPDKHRIKAHLNRMLRSWMQTRGIELELARVPDATFRDKPHLGVVLEHARAGHAMMRCYAPVIGALRKRFHLVGIAAGGSIDAPTRSLFDKVLEVDSRLKSIPETIEAVRSLSLDALYFPSVGMALWAVCLANLRSAPLQFMTLGHPATSHCPHMDAVIVSEGIQFDPAVFSERVVVAPGTAAAFELHPDTLETPPAVRMQPPVIKIAVPAKLFKLSPNFLAACQEIRERATVPVEFHFFPNERGAVFQMARERIEQIIPDAVVYPTTSYAIYLANLDECDLALGALNFGNSNGAVDALLRALPMVALDGPELHQGSEQQLMRPAGLPEWLIAKTREAYVEAALRLINNREERVALSQGLVGRIGQLLKEEGSRHALADTISWLYRQHELVKASERKVWHPEDQHEREDA